MKAASAPERGYELATTGCGPSELAWVSMYHGPSRSAYACHGPGVAFAASASRLSRSAVGRVIENCALSISGKSLGRSFDIDAADGGEGLEPLPLPRLVAAAGGLELADQEQVAHATMSGQPGSPCC